MNQSTRAIDRRLDLDVVFLQFSTLYENDVELAYRYLQLLFLDEAACEARIAFLREIARRVKQQRAETADQAVADDENRLNEERPAERESADSSKQADFSNEIQVIVELGPVRAMQDRRIDADRMDALTRDPDALWQAFEALRREEERLAQSAELTTDLAGETEIATAETDTTIVLDRRRDEPDDEEPPSSSHTKKPRQSDD